VAAVWVSVQLAERQAIRQAATVVSQEHQQEATHLLRFTVPVVALVAQSQQAQGQTVLCS
jgi:hypothetical protein